MIRVSHFRTVGVLLVLVLALAACGGEDTTATAAEGDGSASSEMMSEPMASEMMSEPMSSEMGSEDMAMASDCQLEPLPESGDGSIDTMAEQPAATAASGNPNLSTLVTAVQEAGLVDTLNSEGPFTIFAPANCAFEDIPAEDLEALLANQEQLTTVLTYHVVQGEALSADELAGTDSVETVQGGEVTIAPEGDMLSLNDGQATVVAPNVQVGNGVVHVIDGVLMPGS